MATKKLKMNKSVNPKYFYENGEVCDTGVHMGLGQGPPCWYCPHRWCPSCLHPQRTHSNA